MRRVCIVHNNIDQTSSIGKLAEWSVRTALEAGLEVVAVARDLAPELTREVTWLPLYVPPKLHVVQWAAARRTVLHAMKGRSVDVLHVYQPQIAQLADTWHLAYLSRVGVETDSIQPADGLRGALTRGQQLAVARMEDRYCRRVGSRPTLLFPSESLRAHFTRLYGRPAHEAMLANPSFVGAVMASDRDAARSRLGVPPAAYLVGYLGGIDERKGYRSLLDAMARIGPDHHLLLAGPRSKGFRYPPLAGRMTSAGMLEDTSDFWAAVDVLVAPSRFDPFGMVVTEAAAQGVPVIVTPDVGASDLVARHRSGEVCDASELITALAHVRANGSSYIVGARALTSAVEAKTVGPELLKHWREAFDRNGGRR